MLLFANELIDGITAFMAFLAVAVSISGLFIAHNLFVVHESRKSGIEMMTKLAFHAQDIKICFINITHSKESIKTISAKIDNAIANPQDFSTPITETLRADLEREKQYLQDLYSTYGSCLSNFFSIGTTIKMLFPKNHDKFVFAMNSLMVVATVNHMSLLVSQLSSELDFLLKEYTKMYKEYEANNWYAESLTQLLQQYY